MKIFRFFKIATLLSFIFLAWSCDDDGEGINELEVYGFSINQQPLTDGITNIPVNGNIEVSFSRVLNLDAVKNAITLTGNEATYDLALTNAGSKALITYSGLAPSTQYTLEIDRSPITVRGLSLEQPFSISFTTAASAGDKTPCTAGTASCLQTMTVAGTPVAAFSFYSTYDIIDDTQYVYEDITRAIIVVHGQERNADAYFKYMSDAVAGSGTLQNTLVISPFFKDEAGAGGDDLYWSTDWREGGNSSNTGTAISSFTIIDQLVGHLAQANIFPALKEVMIAGHSSGAMFAQHYGISNKVENTHPELDFSYVVANNQYFYYPDGQRYDEGTGQFYTPTDCAGYTYWPYGYEFAPAYLDGMTAVEITGQQVARKTIYLLGTNDTETSGTLNTTDCAATLLGSDRYHRGLNMFAYFETFYTSQHNHAKVEVPGVGHDAQKMFNSDEFLGLLTE